MDRNEWEALREIAELVEWQAGVLMSQATKAGIQEAVKKAAKALPDSFAVSFEVTLSVTREGRSGRLPVAGRRFVSTKEHEEEHIEVDPPYGWYTVEGERRWVSLGHCPNCWSTWRFSPNEVNDCEPRCERCGYGVGDEILVVLGAWCPGCGRDRSQDDEARCSCCFFMPDSWVDWDATDERIREELKEAEEDDEEGDD